MPPINPRLINKDEIWSPTFVVKGKYPLYGVTARIINNEEYKSIDIIHKDVADIVSIGIFIKLGDLSDREVWVTSDIPISVSSGYKDYIIQYSARNGMWIQFLRIKKINGQWFQATRVVRGKGAKHKVLYEDIDPNFPKDQDGHINWGWGED